MPSRPAVCLVCGTLICLNVAGLGCHLSGIRAPMEAEVVLDVVMMCLNPATLASAMAGGCNDNIEDWDLSAFQL